MPSDVPSRLELTGPKTTLLGVKMLSSELRRALLASASLVLSTRGNSHDSR